MTAKEYLDKLDKIEEKRCKKLALDGYKWFYIGYMFGSGYIHDETNNQEAKEMANEILKTYKDNLDVIMKEWILPITNEENEAKVLKLCEIIQNLKV